MIIFVFVCSNKIPAQVLFIKIYKDEKKILAQINRNIHDCEDASFKNKDAIYITKQWHIIKNKWEVEQGISL